MTCVDYTVLYCNVLYCIVYVAYVVFTLCVVLSNDKFHVRLSHDRITDLRNDINMYVCNRVGPIKLPDGPCTQSKKETPGELN